MTQAIHQGGHTPIICRHVINLCCSVYSSADRQAKYSHQNARMVRQAVVGSVALAKAASEHP